MQQPNQNIQQVPRLENYFLKMLVSKGDLHFSCFSIEEVVTQKPVELFRFFSVLCLTTLMQLQYTIHIPLIFIFALALKFRENGKCDVYILLFFF